MIVDNTAFVVGANCRIIPLDTVPTVKMDVFQQAIADEVINGKRVVALFGAEDKKLNGLCLYAVMADDKKNGLSVSRTKIKGQQFPSLTPVCPQVHLFEREIAEQFGLVPTGHPWMKPVRYHHSWTKDDAWGREKESPILPAVGDFFEVDGQEVHEVAVGPIHAGIIEPGHFRFQCHGEHVFHLEIALGFQHRGVEEALLRVSLNRALHYAETIAGDTTIGHTTSFCQSIEALGQIRKTVHGQVARGIALELERLANHVGDLGALAGDTGFLPTSSYCGRIRGDFLNMTALLCGNRFGRGLVTPGGIGFDIDDKCIEELLIRLSDAEKETANAVNLLWSTQSVMARFENTGVLSESIAAEIGIVGPAARASGLVQDVRYNQPSGIFSFTQLPVSTCESGDVFARAYVRWLEIQQSITFIREQLRKMPSGGILTPVGSLLPDSLVVVLNEGWRGEICHTVITDDKGGLARYKIVDPSFHNWMGLSYAMRDQQISDFPLCNKSFNLSYCGHDL